MVTPRTRGTSGCRLAQDPKSSSPNVSHWLSRGGVDHTHCVAGCVNSVDSPIGPYDGWLRKFTIAPQIRAGRKFFDRPVLRVFLTYASWSGGFRGLVGGVPFQS